MTLTERLLVFGLIGVVATVGLNAYETRKRSADLLLTQAHINASFIALNALYEQHCTAVSPPVIDSAMLLATNLITNEELESPLGYTLVPAIDWSVSPTELSINMVVNTNDVDEIENSLSPTSRSGLTLTWRTSPTFISTHNEASMYKAMYESECL